MSEIALRHSAENHPVVVEDNAKYQTIVMLEGARDQLWMWIGRPTFGHSARDGTKVPKTGPEL